MQQVPSGWYTKRAYLRMGGTSGRFSAFVPTISVERPRPRWRDARARRSGRGPRGRYPGIPRWSRGTRFDLVVGRPGSAGAGLRRVGLVRLRVSTAGQARSARRGAMHRPTERPSSERSVSAAVPVSPSAGAGWLSRPRPSRGLVWRPRLIDALDAGVRRTVTLICAGPGWGKTALAASWAEARSRSGPTAWLTLDAQHNDPYAFWSDVLLALQTAGARSRSATCCPTWGRRFVPATRVSRPGGPGDGAGTGHGGARARRPAGGR